MEPRSDFRTAATVAREVFTAMVDAGFTEAQAMQVVLALLTRGV